MTLCLFSYCRVFVIRTFHTLYYHVLGVGGIGCKAATLSLCRHRRVSEQSPLNSLKDGLENKVIIIDGFLVPR